MLEKRADLQALCSLPSGGILAAQRAGSSASTISSCMHCRLGRRWCYCSCYGCRF